MKRTKLLIPNRAMGLEIVRFLLAKDMTFSFTYRVCLMLEIPHLSAKACRMLLVNLINVDVEITDDP